MAGASAGLQRGGGGCFGRSWLIPPAVAAEERRVSPPRPREPWAAPSAGAPRRSRPCWGCRQRSFQGEIRLQRVGSSTPEASEAALPPPHACSEASGGKHGARLPLGMHNRQSRSCWRLARGRITGPGPRQAGKLTGPELCSFSFYFSSLLRCVSLLRHLTSAVIEVQEPVGKGIYFSFQIISELFGKMCQYAVLPVPIRYHAHLAVRNLQKVKVTSQRRKLKEPPCISRSSAED
ncbi:uncharacterized protein LOC113985986 [Pipra filicauda]|uniref:Uncharacterized protein LOC113985986 n=1 Tax=Pipra filicauda TaxID=649802 RepID=A0A6J2GCT5_9PASS|nr:uncharacterized protein LOC113985986 [Pipra filicauda]